MLLEPAAYKIWQVFASAWQAGLSLLLRVSFIIRLRERYNAMRQSRRGDGVLGHRDTPDLDKDGNEWMVS